jgi:hypothetical protein
VAVSCEYGDEASGSAATCHIVSLIVSQSVWY